MRIIVDGMGGDNCPDAVIEGCVEALKENKSIEIMITGPEELLNEKLKNYQYDANRFKVINASEVIGTNEHPAMAVKRKKDSSLVKALRMVKDGEGDAVISAGSTGAFLTGATLVVGRIKGIKRPALAPVMPGKNGPFMVVDCGANVDCRPEYLLQFALMGTAYYKSVMGVENPKVGLVNIGAEEEKGNELTKATYQLLKESGLNFIGNVEPRDVTSGDVEVLVCDGFVGNTILKMYEGVSSNIFSILKKEVYSSTRTKIGGIFMKPVFKKFKTDYDYKAYGGAAFLGVNGVCIKAHGSSDGRAIKNAIKQGVKFYENQLIEKIKVGLDEINIEINAENE